MIRLDPVGIGERLSRYRRLNRLTAEELAQRAGNGLTRSIVANIEAGRRADVGVRQLFAMAWVLRVPLSALLLPLETPNAEVPAVGERPRQVRELLAWLDGRRIALPADEVTPALKATSALLNAIDALAAAERRLWVMETTISTAVQRGTYENAEMAEWERARREAEEDIYRQKVLLESLGGQAG